MPLSLLRVFFISSFVLLAALFVHGTEDTSIVRHRERISKLQNMDHLVPYPSPYTLRMTKRCEMTFDNQEYDGSLKHLSETTLCPKGKEDDVFDWNLYKRGAQCDDDCWWKYILDTYGHGIQPFQGFTGMACMLIGVYFLLFGYRFFRATLAWTGFVLFAIMVWIGLTNSEPEDGYPRAALVYLCVCIGIGLIGGFVFMFLYALSIYFVGVLSGLLLGVYVLSWKTELIIHAVIGRISVVVGLGVLLGFLIFLAERYAVIFSTAFIGAYMFIFGLDFFVHTGLINAWRLILDGNRHHYIIYLVQTRVYIMLAFVAVIMLLSVGWQYYWCAIKHNRYFGVNTVPEHCEKA